MLESSAVMLASMTSNMTNGTSRATLKYERLKQL
jgi:hypothetical protein